jgi:hypothetical protein
MTTAVHVTVNGEPLNARFDLREHSPTGFEWGYEGSGPAQLALALLADHLADDDKACELYQEFKRRIVARLPRGQWSLVSEQIEAAIKSFQEENV